LTLLSSGNAAASLSSAWTPSPPKAFQLLPLSQGISIRCRPTGPLVELVVQKRSSAAVTTVFGGQGIQQAVEADQALGETPGPP
jgi:hypothetical protein